MNFGQYKWFALFPAGISALIGAAVLSVALLIQHYNHGWPFSLHHDLSTAQIAKLPPVGTGIQPTTPAERIPPPRVAVTVETSRLGASGIRTEAVRSETITAPIHAVATVVPDESRVSHVHTRVAGWIEALYVNTTGQKVRAGQPLAAIFSQELFSSQTEYLTALKQFGDGPSSVVTAGARTRLKVLGMAEAEIGEIERQGSAKRLVTVVAPHSGLVLHRGVVVGTAVDASTEIMTVADLTQVWILAEVPEAGAAEITPGTPAVLAFPATGRPPFEARVDFIYPTLSERTRTLRVRFAVANPDGALRPGSYGTADFRIQPRGVITVPRDAVVDTGPAQHVFVVTAPGRFEPRPVTLGLRLPDRVEIRSGLILGETVVTSGVFLLDSESRLRASGGGTAHGGHGSPAKGSQPERPGDTGSPPAAQPHTGH